MTQNRTEQSQSDSTEDTSEQENNQTSSETNSNEVTTSLSLILSTFNSISNGESNEDTIPDSSVRIAPVTHSEEELQPLALPPNAYFGYPTLQAEDSDDDDLPRNQSPTFFTQPDNESNSECKENNNSPSQS